MVDDNGEFKSMRQQVARFDSPPTFEDIKTRVNTLFKVGNEGDELRIHEGLIPVTKEITMC
jgi:hypothetical protein